HALEDTARGCATADRPRRTVDPVHPVTGAQAREAVALHDPGSALALGGARDIDDGSWFEDLRRGQLLAEPVPVDRVGAQLDEPTARRDTGLREMPGRRLRHPARVNGTEGQLHGVVPVDRLGTD